MIRAWIVDDEPLAREEMAELLQSHTDIMVCGESSNAIEALQQIAQHKPDLVFLDIQMPRISGMEMIAMLDPAQMPRIVFVTAYDEFAIKAFEHNAFDYLLKPIDEHRLAITLDRVRQDAEPQSVHHIAPERLQHIPGFNHHKLRVMPLDKVEYAFSDLTGVHVMSGNEQMHTQLTLKQLEQKTDLIRCHRQYLVRLAGIAEIEPIDNGSATIISHSGHAIPVSRRYLKTLKQSLGF